MAAKATISRAAARASRHAELVVSQFRQARGRGILCGAPRAIECRPLRAGEQASDIAPCVNHGKIRPVIVANADQLAPGAQKRDASLDRGNVLA